MSGRCTTSKSCRLVVLLDSATVCENCICNFLVIPTGLGNLLSMSFKKSSSKVKSFVTEEEAQNINVKRQEEWEKVRRPEDPLECPEEEHHSLFEQLQAQKEKAQQEHDEKYNIKNMFRGLDNDEAAFLEFASKQQAEVDNRRYADTSEVLEYRSEVAKLHATIPTDSSGVVKEKKKPSLPQSSKKSQHELLAGGIKTKRKRSETDDSAIAKPLDRLDNNADFHAEPRQGETEGNTEGGGKKRRDLYQSCGDSKHLPVEELRTSEQCPVDCEEFSYNSAYTPGSIPTLGIYSDSSDSESSSSDSDILPSLFSFSSNSNSK